ncbi:MAG: hypothetical protein CMH61_02075 [Nanoarchaeota archaeon]|nr:hypothetical protein [Nanoarchaeota archaeon]|tara:strand:+ start:556 stop:1125 length:570 start_codon:yes stop_codon:yes gene_type:complete
MTILTISGTPGSGKSTIAKILQSELQAERIYVGGIRRELARSKGMTLEELNEYAQTHPETDVDVDKAATKVARESQNKFVLVEGRVMFHFLPESLKIYIKVSDEEGAKRIWKDLQNKETQQERNEGNIQSFEEMKTRLKERTQNDAKRYEKYYQLNPYDESHYDFILDTTTITAQQGADRILEYIKKNL